MLILTRTLKVILERTFDEDTTQLNELHLVNTNWSETIKNRPYSARCCFGSTSLKGEFGAQTPTMSKKCTNWDFMIFSPKWVLEYYKSTLLGSLVLDDSAGDVDCREILICVSFNVT